MADMEFDPVKNADWSPAPEGSWNINKPEFNLDPVQIEAAAQTIANAKRAMEILKKSLDALKTGKKEKEAGEGAQPTQSTAPITPAPQSSMATEALFGSTVPQQDAEAMEGLNNPQPQY